MVIYLANKVDGTNPTNGKILSSNLSLYLSRSFTANKINQQFLNDLENINWILAKEKPNDWNLPWSTEIKRERIFFKPKELISDKYQTLVGCVSFLLDSSISGEFLKSQSFNEYSLINSLIEQLKLMINLLEISRNISIKILCQIEEFFRNFYSSLQQFSTENKQIQEN